MSPAGEYAFFTIPGKDEWTVILSKNVKSWGAYDYKQDTDALRVMVKPCDAPRPGRVVHDRFRRLEE